MIALLEKEDVWHKLQNTRKDIILYGMGNGADRIIDQFNQFSIHYSDIFASDQFVRGHFFHGKKVLTYQEVCEKYTDFIIVMTFAIHDGTTLRHIKSMTCKHEFYSLTVPVAGNGLFTRHFVEQHLDKFERVYHLLETDYDKQVYTNIINFKISGNPSYLFDSYSEKEEIYDSILKLDQNDVIVDLGAYNGDTVKEFVTASKGKYKKIIALEPDEKNYKKLVLNTANDHDIETYPYGAWDKNDTLFFNKTAGRQSKIDTDGTLVQVVCVDELIDDKITLLKMDIEGSEGRAIKGAADTIRKYHPKLYICAYHRNEDLFALPLQIFDIDPTYKFYIRQHPYIPAWECNFYMV